MFREHPCGVILPNIYWMGRFAVLFGLWLGCFVGSAVACPMFVEFFPDPKDVPDAEGEFVEIRLDDFRNDSLFVKFEDKSLLAFGFPRGDRFLLVHDSLQCPKREGVACGSLEKVSLPNSRESVWRLWSGSCRDSVVVPVPKAGMAFQRVGESDEFVFAEGTPGTANPDYELGLDDCGIAWGRLDSADGVWLLRGFLSGCDSAVATLEYRPLFSAGGWQRQALALEPVFRFEVPASGSVQVRLSLPPDMAPANDVLDTMLVGSEPPAVISEVHHCPAEPEPEWVEVYNASRYALPLSRLNFCGRGGFWNVGPEAGQGDSLRPYESVVVTKDTAGLRDYLGFKDVRLLQVTLGYLNNTAGSLSLCYGGAVLDSVAWDKNTVACPSGFSPVTRHPENTPGFYRSSTPSKNQDPFQYKLSSRVVSRRGQPLRVSITSDSETRLQLLDSTGRSLWKRSVPAASNSWWDVPVQEMCSLGVCYVSMSVGTFEKVVGIVLRP